MKKMFNRSIHHKYGNVKRLKPPIGFSPFERIMVGEWVIYKLKVLLHKFESWLYEKTRTPWKGNS